MAEVNEVTELINRMTGNSDLITKKCFESLVIEERIVDSDLSDISMEFFGEKLDTPIMLGVIGGFNKLGENALLKSAEAAKELNSVLWISSHTSDEEVQALTATGARVIQIIKPYLDQEYFLGKVKRAEELGCFAVGTDIDHAYGKKGGYDIQGLHPFGPKSVVQLKEAVSSVSIPFIAKGVLSVQDAVKCQEAGVAAIILSHHHNIMNSSVPPVMILPDVRKAVGDTYCVLVDCGINSGTEAFKAMALGASGLCIARSYMAPLAREGKQGVVDHVNKMTGELQEFLNRTGSKDIKSIDPTVIHQLPF